jgi:LPS export ABC transporter protein LptC
VTRWQTRARAAVGAFGAGCAILVYLALGERARPSAPPPIERIDSRAIAESTQGVLHQVRGLHEDFQISYETSATYDDGSSRLTGVSILVTNDDGRTYVVTAREARVSGDGRRYELQHDVVLQTGDGFEVRTDSASFAEDDATVRAQGTVTFGKGTMSGSGVGMTYDRGTDVLHVADRARIALERAGSPMRTAATRATLDRVHGLLTLEERVRVIETAQTIVSDAAHVRLSPDGNHVTYVELRGGSRVDGGSAGVESMRARDIDLDYTGDGAALEGATLSGGAVVVLRPETGGSSKEISGESIEVGLRPGGGMERLIARTRVRMSLPASGGEPARRIDAETLEASGGADGGLTAARFDGGVEFREEPARGRGAARVARSRTLALDLAADGAVSSARFTGGATFEEEDLQARAAEARYDPGAGTLALGGADARGEPHVADRRVMIDARVIEMALDGRRIEAEDQVKTTLLPADGARPGGRPGLAGAREGRLPGLLAPDQSVRVTAGRLTYDGAAQVARYTGDVWLWQKETELRADRIDIDQATADLTAVGRARAVIALENGRSEGEAHEIAYADAARRITYASGGGAGPVRVTGPQGDLRAQRAELFLAEHDGRMTRLEAYGSVDVTMASRTVTGDRLTYRVADEGYVVTGGAEAPVRLWLADECQEFVGRALTFSGAADTMKIDGREVSRTESRRGPSCP